MDKDARNRENKMLLTDTPKKLLMSQVTVTRLQVRLECAKNDNLTLLVIWSVTHHDVAH